VEPRRREPRRPKTYIGLQHRLNVIPNLVNLANGPQAYMWVWAQIRLPPQLNVDPGRVNPVNPIDPLGPLNPVNPVKPTCPLPRAQAHLLGLKLNVTANPRHLEGGAAGPFNWMRISFRHRLNVPHPVNPLQPGNLEGAAVNPVNWTQISFPHLLNDPYPVKPVKSVKPLQPQPVDAVNPVHRQSQLGEVRELGRVRWFEEVDYFSSAC
jgi:hypothetical protein